MRTINMKLGGGLLLLGWLMAAAWPGLVWNQTKAWAATITGNIQFTGSAQADIYVLALLAQDVSQIRTLETLSVAYDSSYVRAVELLQGAGAYSFTDLPDGDYVVWAWADLNHNKGVEHLDFAEPTGWYQTQDHLSPQTVSLTAGQTLSNINLELISPTPYPQEDLNVAQGEGGGTLKTIEGHKVLHLWGTADERAYAQGYLVGPQIKDFFQYFVLEERAGSVSYYEDSFLPFLQSNASAVMAFQDEFCAMIDGMEQRGVDMWVNLLDRDLTWLDLAAINSIDLLTYHKAMHGISAPSSAFDPPECSAATVWGPWTSNAELNGTTLYGKNNDGENDLRKVTVNDLLIMAIEPDPGSGLNSYVGIDWPGFIGTYCAMNQEGLVMASHGAMSVPDWRTQDFMGYAFYYRQAMLTQSEVSQVLPYWNSLNATPLGGWNTSVAQPYRRTLESGGLVAGSIETDAYGGLVRQAGYVDPGENQFLLTTNDFYQYQGAFPWAVSRVHGYHDHVLPTDYRYLAMRDKLYEFRDQGDTIGTNEMIQVLQAAARTPQYQGINEFSFLAYPDQMRFALATEDLAAKILDAAYTTFTYYDFAEVFQ